jgi:hypothetical protein
VQIADNIGQTDIIRPISDFSGLSDAYDTCVYQTRLPLAPSHGCHRHQLDLLLMEDSVAASVVTNTTVDISLHYDLGGF